MHVNAEMTRHTRIIIDYEFEGSMQGSIISVLSAFLQCYLILLLPIAGFFSQYFHSYFVFRVPVCGLMTEPCFRFLNYRYYRALTREKS